MRGRARWLFRVERVKGSGRHAPVSGKRTARRSSRGTTVGCSAEGWRGSRREAWKKRVRVAPRKHLRVRPVGLGSLRWSRSHFRWRGVLCRALPRACPCGQVRSSSLPQAARVSEGLFRKGLGLGWAGAVFNRGRAWRKVGWRARTSGGVSLSFHFSSSG